MSDPIEQLRIQVSQLRSPMVNEDLNRIMADVDRILDNTREFVRAYLIEANGTGWRQAKEAVETLLGETTDNPAPKERES